MVYSAAINAQGIAIGDAFICRDAMAAGHLIRPFDLAVKPARPYYLWIPPARRDIASVIAFRNRILAGLPG